MDRKKKLKRRSRPISDAEANRRARAVRTRKRRQLAKALAVLYRGFGWPKVRDIELVLKEYGV